MSQPKQYEITWTEITYHSYTVEGDSIQDAEDHAMFLSALDDPDNPGPDTNTGEGSYTDFKAVEITK